MHVISKRPFLDAIKKFPNDRFAIESTYSLLNRGKFKSPEELKRLFKSLDNFKYKDKWWVIDIGGNNLRLLAFIEFRHNRVFVKHILTHAEYDKLCKAYRN
ncbi:type II toxin-antitoxin system HigB family toxin [Agaribacter marinus]|uniref:Cytoplasmic protein n=1 Tax=Agaribacter marinus TaxID=1431249 RepID=A0AA37SV36_9ALTE|nr:type II toxin-antitoxin system HigB family toxin [Agaribacter marinus]GLR69269.1 hypothetical protein GCM10007852_01770 [Agaribacter marinus]